MHRQKRVVYVGHISTWSDPAKKLRKLMPKLNVTIDSLISIIASMLNLLSQKITKFYTETKIHSTGTIKNDVIHAISQILENLKGQDHDRYIKEGFLVHKQNHLIRAITILKTLTPTWQKITRSVFSPIKQAKHRKGIQKHRL